MNKSEEEKECDCDDIGCLFLLGVIGLGIVWGIVHAIGGFYDTYKESEIKMLELKYRYEKQKCPNFRCELE